MSDLSRITREVLEAAHTLWEKNLASTTGSLYICDCIQHSAAALSTHGNHHWEPTGVHVEVCFSLKEVVMEKLNSCRGVPEFLGLITTLNDFKADQRHPDVIAFRKALWAELKEMFK